MKIDNNDQAARERALIPNQSFIVQAPAGSGKTELLTQRYLMLLSLTEKAPEEIIAITFTRKAAAEMKNRILNALSKAKDNQNHCESHKKITQYYAQKVLEKNKKLNWNLIENPNRLRILTIDALCSRICADIPLLSHFGSQPKILESPENYYSIAAKQTILMLEEESPWQAAIEKLLLHLDNKAYLLHELLTHILAKRDQWLPFIMQDWNDPEKLKMLLEQGLYHIRIEAMQMVKKYLPKHLLPELVRLSHLAGCYLIENDPKHPLAIFHQRKKIPKIHPDDFPYWYAFSSLLLTQSGQWRNTINKRCGFPAKSEYKPQMESLLDQLSNNDDLLAALNAVLNCPPMHYQEKQWEIIQSLIDVLPLLTAQLNLIFQQQGGIDFVELNLAALRALGDDEQPTDLALYMDYKIQHILVDEFQDTSIIQFNLLKQLTSGWQPNDGRSIFIVGDPMQSIYRFRNARVGLFLRAKNEGINNIPLEFLQLTVNFRSKKSIVDWTNHIFSTLFPKQSDIALGAISYSPAVANNREIQTNNIVCHPIKKEDNEADKIIEVIKQCQRNNSDTSIAILVRSRSHLVDIIPKLRECNIKFQALELESLNHRSEIQDILALTRALLHHGDQTAWLSILRAPWCGLLLADLQIIAQKAKNITIWDALNTFDQLKTLSEDARLRLNRIVPVLSNALIQQGRMPFCHWIKGVWIALGGPATLHFFNQIDNVESFFHCLESLNDNPDDFSLERLESETQQLFATTENQSDSKVQIMTIHRAKGLEFDHVLIPGLSRRTPNEKNAILIWQERISVLGSNDLILAPIKGAHEDVEPIYQYLRQIEKKKLDLESARLLYVAITRSKESLHFFSDIKSEENDPLRLKAPPKGSFMDMLWPIFHEQLQATLLYPSNEYKQTSSFQQKTSANLYRLTKDWKLPLMENMNFSLMEKHAFNNEKPIDISTMKFDHHFSRITGSIIHEAMQQIAENYSEKINLMQIIQSSKQQWENRLLALSMPQAYLKEGIDKIITAVSHAVNDAKGQWILRPHQDAHNEYSLSAVIDDELAHVILDRCFIDEKGYRWIIDYKTAHQEKNSVAEFLDQQQALYASQLNQYAKIMQLLEDRPIKLGLYFPLLPAWCEWDFKQ